MMKTYNYLSSCRLGLVHSRLYSRSRGRFVGICSEFCNYILPHLSGPDGKLETSMSSQIKTDLADTTQAEPTDTPRFFHLQRNQTTAQYEIQRETD